MKQLPKMKHLSQKKNITVKVSEDIESIYKEGRHNGWDVSEIARQVLTETFEKLAQDLKRPAS